MNNNLTIDALGFNLVFSDKAGSERREVSRGVNLPEVMSVRHVEITDSKTKKLATQSSLRFERHLLSSDLTTVVPVTATLTVRVPKDTGVVSADVLAVIQRVVSTVAGTLILADEIFVNREQ